MFKLPLQPYKPAYFQPINGASIVEYKNSATFGIKVGDDTKVYAAGSDIEAKDWIKSIKEVIGASKPAIEVEGLSNMANAFKKKK